MHNLIFIYMVGWCEHNHSREIWTGFGIIYSNCRWRAKTVQHELAALSEIYFSRAKTPFHDVIFDLIPKSITRPYYKMISETITSVLRKHLSFLCASLRSLSYNFRSNLWILSLYAPANLCIYAFITLSPLLSFFKRDRRLPDYSYLTLPPHMPVYTGM